MHTPSHSARLRKKADRPSNEPWICIWPKLQIMKSVKRWTVPATTAKWYWNNAITLSMNSYKSNLVVRSSCLHFMKTETTNAWFDLLHTKLTTGVNRTNRTDYVNGVYTIEHAVRRTRANKQLHKHIKHPLGLHYTRAWPTHVNVKGQANCISVARTNAVWDHIVRSITNIWRAQIGWTERFLVLQTWWCQRYVMRCQQAQTMKTFTITQYKCKQTRDEF